MGSKKKTYILLTVVILVWGLIGFRIYKAVKPAIPKIKTSDKIASFKPINVIKNDTFSLKSDYRDPFLGTFAIKKRTQKTTKKKTKLKPEKITKIIFPKIRFKGIIAPKNNNAKRFIIKINANKVLFKLLETHQEIKLLKGDDKEVVVLYKGEQKTIVLN